jgi:hypothetical protein
VGVGGLLYWYGLWAIHQVVFAGMLRNIIRAVRELPGCSHAKDPSRRPQAA